MKTFDQQLAAWLDGQLSGPELAAFERHIESHPELLPDCESDSDLLLGAFLRTNLTPPRLTTPDFFNFQLLERIQALTPIVPPPRRVFWSLPRMVFSGAFLLLLSTILFFAAVPSTNRQLRHNQKYVQNILHATSTDPAITATSFHSDQDNVNVVWLDGLNYMPRDHKLK